MLCAALSADNTVRRRAEAALSYARTQRGFAVALAKQLASNYYPRGGAYGDDGDLARAAAATAERSGMWMPMRLMAGMLLQHFVRDRWELADDAVLPAEDKIQVSSSSKQRTHAGNEYRLGFLARSTRGEGRSGRRKC